MRVIIDIEANSLTNPTKVWLVVLKNIEDNKIHIFRNLHEDNKDFINFVKDVSHWIGHNVIEYDFPVLHNVIGYPIPDIGSITDTLILSRLVNYPRVQGHSLSSYGEEFGLPKLKFNDWTKWSQQMEDYCVRDVEINHRIYDRFVRVLSDEAWLPAIRLEHRFQCVVNTLHRNGFAFNGDRARELLRSVETTLSEIDSKILEQFPPRLRLVRLVEPELTKHGTLNRKDFRWIKDGNISDYNGGSFCKCTWSTFNPSSHKQVIQVLQEAGWRPVDKTQTHIDTLREINHIKFPSRNTNGLLLDELNAKLKILEKSGWKINENNLSTLPPDAPSPARTLATRILYESRRRTLTEWIGLQTDGRIHGKFVGIGAWTHRMAHQRPNLANIPNATKEDGSVKILGKELRSLWRAPKGRLLVGVDAEGIQLRIFAHYINDKEFTEALVNGRKDNKTDPHSLNANIIGCTRAQAKRFIYALLLGGGISKLSWILERREDEAKEALDKILKRYTGFDFLRREVIPNDAEKGYFTGLDGRKVRIPGDTVSERRHLCMSGYLQNGEAIIMKKATLEWVDKLGDYDAKLVNLVHDEWQVECPNDITICLAIAGHMCDSLRLVGQQLKLNCPLAGSYWNDDKKDYTFGTNWYQTH